MAAQCSVRGNRTVSHHNVVTTNRRSILAHRRRTHRWQHVITFITDWLFLITRSNWNWLKAAVIKVHVFVRRLANILLPLYTISSAGSWTCWPSSSVPLCWAGYAIAFTNCGRLFLLLKNNTLWNQLMSSLFSVQMYYLKVLLGYNIAIIGTYLRFSLAIRSALLWIYEVCP